MSGKRAVVVLALPDAVVTGTRARYVEAFERLTRIAFDDYVADPELVVR